MPSPPKADRERRRLELTAYREAGHAVAAIELRRVIRYVTIVPEVDALGHILKTLPPKTLRPDIECDRRAVAWMEREILIGLAGPAAEERFAGRRNHIGVSSDYRNAIDLAARMHGNNKVLEKWLDYMAERARAFIGNPIQWVRVEDLAAALLVTPHIGVSSARVICKEAVQQHERIRAMSQRADAEDDVN